MATQPDGRYDEFMTSTIPVSFYADPSSPGLAYTCPAGVSGQAGPDRSEGDSLEGDYAAATAALKAAGIRFSEDRRDRSDGRYAEIWVYTSDLDELADVLGSL